MLVVLSPKFHAYDVITPVDVLVNFTGKGISPDIGVADILATGGFGGAFAVIVIVFALVPPGPVTVNVALYVPALVYVCVGLLTLLVALSPNFHAYDVTAPVTALVNFTGTGALPDVGVADILTCGAFDTDKIIF